MMLSIFLLSLLPCCFASLQSLTHRHGPSHDTAKRAYSNPDPAVDGTTDSGWGFLPTIPDADSHPDWVIDSKTNAQIPAFQSSGLNTTEVKRAVIILPGKPRDCWYYWNVMNNALYLASEEDATIKREEVSIFGPCFFNAADLAAGAATSDQLIWGDTTWISGFQNVGPDGMDYSSYDVLDSLVSYYMDKDLYPNLNTVVMGGHSAGAQLAQRYMTLRKSTKHDDRLHFWIANPGSLLWLTEDRPAPNDTCEGVDDFKYGLGGGFPAYATTEAKKRGRDGLATRARQRNAHFAWGLADDGAGDTRCQAITQGSSHLERGQNFVAMLEGMEGGMPNHTTVDYVEGASHDNVEMMNSDAGIDKLFRNAYNGTSVVYATSGEPDYQTADSDGSATLLVSHVAVFSVLLAIAVQALL